MRQKNKQNTHIGMRQRWLWRTAAIACLIGTLCVLIVTATFSSRLYRQREQQIKGYVDVANTYFNDRVNKSETEFYSACVVYTQTCDTGENLDLQFVDPSGVVVSSSAETADGLQPGTEEIANAITSRGICTYIGLDATAGKRIIAVSAPIIANGGDVIGVLRFVADATQINRHIISIAVAALGIVMVMIVLLLLTINHYVQAVLEPIAQISEKAQMIAGGSYGIQIQTNYDDEIGVLAKTINEMSMEINQNEKTQTEFISSLSHELRTPLTAITGWSETLLHSDDLDEGTRRGMKIIHREAGRLTEMVLSLLDYTRIQSGRMTLNIEPTDLRSEFEDTVFMYGSRLEAEGIHLEYIDNEDDIPEIACDPQRMRQVFLNILDNASKHGGEGKRIDAEICSMEDGVAVRIRDYGPGIPEDEIPLVTKKFYKGSSKARGSGIGLAVCDEIVEMHGGQLILENAPGGGTLVTVQLPVSS